MRHPIWILDSFFTPLPHASASRGQEFGGDIPFRIESFKVSHSLYCLTVGLCTCSLLRQEETSVMLKEHLVEQ